ncbi:hypothetical protein J6590_049519 [Homalodisca vitripennis]|nr:hypothetical protein J6590_049519 [Homalodisca vitripennis]
MRHITAHAAASLTFTKADIIGAAGRKGIDTRLDPPSSSSLATLARLLSSYTSFQERPRATTNSMRISRE